MPTIRTRGRARRVIVPDGALIRFTLSMQASRRDEAQRRAREAWAKACGALDDMAGELAVINGEALPVAIPKEHPAHRQLYVARVTAEAMCENLTDAEAFWQAVTRNRRLSPDALHWVVRDGDGVAAVTASEALREARLAADGYAAALNASVVGMGTVNDLSGASDWTRLDDGALAVPCLDLAHPFGGDQCRVEVVREVEVALETRP